MQVLSASFLAGPNLHHRESMLVVTCELAALPEVLALISGAAPGAVGALPAGPDAVPARLRPLAVLWREAAGTAKPFLEQLLHVALALQRDVIVSPALRGTVLGVSGSTVSVALQCDVGEVGLSAWQLAVLSVALFFTARRERAQQDALETALSGRYGAFRETAQSRSLDQLTIAMLREAGKRDIPWQRLGFPSRFVQLGHAKHRRRLHETMIDTTSFFAVRLAQNKASTRLLLHRMGFPVPEQSLVDTPEGAVEAASRIGYPVVLKPCHGSRGRGVSVGMATAEQVRRAFAAAAEGGDAVVVESVVAGDDHRLLVVGRKLVAGARRLPAQVIGNGRSSVAELTEELNLDPRRGRDFEKWMTVVDIDREAVEVLAQQGLDVSSVPADGQRVCLRRTANIHTGGTAVDVTNTMHPDNIRLAEDAALAVGLDVIGIDFMTRDITRSWREIGGAIIEVNANPGLRPHWVGDGGRRNVAGPILDLLYPRGAPARIPTVAITGSIGKTTTCRMVARILAGSGKRVGLSTTQGVHVDGVRIQTGDHAGGISAGNLLLRPEIEAGVFEMASDGLIKAGMVIDRCDVGVVLNVLDNHLGLDGVHSRETMARVKRIVAENAKEMAVLNADDPLCLAMRAHVRSRRLCMFSVQPENPELASHRSTGGCTVVIDDRDGPARIVLAEGDRVLGTLVVSAVPAALEGRAMGTAVNAAFAVAAAHGLGIDFETAAAALSGFESAYEANPGRLSLQ